MLLWRKSNQASLQGTVSYPLLAGTIGISDGSQPCETQEIAKQRRDLILGMTAAGLLPMAGSAFAQNGRMEKDTLRALKRH
ncbi:hypothetical protein ASC96_31300 [Rhizobium sp. Root1204]|nr:hypothetical protein ASC96_31300 [Rhizobium sp. Root1204]